MNVTYSQRALSDLDRLFDFIGEHDPFAAARAAKRITEAVSMLQNHPHVGRPVRGALRELVISHGRSGYVALYRASADNVVVLAIRHQREAGFQ
ncbi:MAG: type II toxin-antitoxin system RelE/ParE family toxin [Burkholderiaceae bacterium]